MTYRKQIVALTGAAGFLLAASTALAQGSTTVACADTTVLGNPVYMAGSSAFEPILGQLAVQINDINDSRRMLAAQRHLRLDPPPRHAATVATINDVHRQTSSRIAPAMPP